MAWTCVSVVGAAVAIDCSFSEVWEVVVVAPAISCPVDSTVACVLLVSDDGLASGGSFDKGTDPFAPTAIEELLVTIGGAAGSWEGAWLELTVAEEVFGD